jgi:hypothetical protein
MFAPFMQELAGYAARGKTDYCVSLDTAESDLARISKTELDVVLPDNPFVFVADPDELRAVAGKIEGGAQVWKTLVWTALVLMLLETLLARFFGSHRGIRKKG